MPETSGSAPGETRSPFEPGFAPECMLCPFGMFFYAVKNTKPEVMDHFMKAGMELFQAFKALMDQYAERWEQTQGRQTIERIEID